MAHEDDKPAILVVEDDAALRRLIVRMLHRGGFATLATGRAADGLSIVRQRQGVVDLAIVDIVMPGMSGLDLATDFDREYPCLKILYISGYVDSIVADVLSRRSPDRMLLKPFTERTLLGRVHLILEAAAKREPGNAGDSTGPQIRSGTLG
jgi:two-component system, cell cycle sensor histidine kinase and response regulator CckA